MPAAPIILVPGFWLGAWAWDEVVDLLRTDGHAVTAITLPGLESIEVDRSMITLMDQVEALISAIDETPAKPVVAVHSASGFTGYVASDRIPERIGHLVYVDTAPGKPPLDADFEGVEKALDWDSLVAEENLDGLTDEHKAIFRERAVPVPGSALREPYTFVNDARCDVPSTIIATAFSSEEYRKYAAEHPEWSFLAGIPELRDLSFVDLPTSHWPMWSKPRELATIVGDIATQTGATNADATR